MIYGSLSELDRGALWVLYPTELKESELAWAWAGEWGWSDKRKDGLIYYTDNRYWWEIDDPAKEGGFDAYPLLDEEIRDVNYLVSGGDA